FDGEGPVRPAGRPELLGARMSTSTVAKAGEGLGNFLDERIGASKVTKSFSRKLFPDHWSFMLGEIALYSFVILLLTGTYLPLFFHASSREIIYNGSYQPLRGVR